MKCRQCVVRVGANSAPSLEFEVNLEMPMKLIERVFSALHGDRKSADGDGGNHALQLAVRFPMLHTVKVG